NSKLQAQLDALRKAVGEGEIKSLQSNLTLEKVHGKEMKLQNEQFGIEINQTTWRCHS
ncbi:hypothetical protein AG4045_027094, partial [Apium graveolens]